MSVNIYIANFAADDAEKRIRAIEKGSGMTHVEGDTYRGDFGLYTAVKCGSDGVATLIALTPDPQLNHEDDQK